MGIMEKNMETTLMGYIGLRVYLEGQWRVIIWPRGVIKLLTKSP